MEQVTSIENKLESNKTKNIIQKTARLSISNSVERVSKKAPQIDKAFELKLQNKSIQEIEDYLKQNIANLVELYYEMELSILVNGFISFEMAKELKGFKALISLCKIALCIPEFDDITFPSDFAEEYTTLLGRTNKAIESIKVRIEKLNNAYGMESLRCVLEKNLMKLMMLHWHYICALGIKEDN